MATGMMYLAVLSATVDQAPEAAPVCGGEFVPAFVTELDAWNAVLEMEKTAQSKVAKTVASAASAATPSRTTAPSAVPRCMMPCQNPCFG